VRSVTRVRPGSGSASASPGDPLLRCRGAHLPAGAFGREPCNDAGIPDEVAMLSPVTFDYRLCLQYETLAGTAVVFALLPARTHQQQLAMERLVVRGSIVQSVFTDAATATRFLYVTARGGLLSIELEAQLRLLQTEFGEHRLLRPPQAAPMAAPESLRFLLASRYCPSDRLVAWCEREFLAIDPPLSRVRAIDAWLRRHVALSVPRSADPDAAPADAVQVLERRSGSPRDLAHLMIALCRAARLPARYVTTAPFAGPSLNDLHPWVEVLVEDAWLAFDPSGLMPRTALVRIGTGRDAADVPLVFMHGSAITCASQVRIDCRGTEVGALWARDRGAEAIGSATLGSLGEATRWHQEARLAARRPQPLASEPAAGRSAGSGARRGAQVFAFPPHPAFRTAPGRGRSGADPR